MLNQVIAHVLEREKVLAVELQPFASDLRLIEAADLVRLICRDQHAHVAHLVDASSELYFKAGSLRFGTGSDIHLTWDALPEIRLGLEFHDRRVSVYFDLLLSRDDAGVAIKYMSFAGEDASQHELTRTLRDALSDARI